MKGLSPSARRAAAGAIGGGQGAGGDGAMMPLDINSLQGVLSQFQKDFTQGLGSTVEPMKDMSASLQGIATHLQQLNDTFANLTMTHQFQGDMTMAFSITNANELKTAIAKEMTGTMRQIILEHLEKQGKDFTAGP